MIIIRTLRQGIILLLYYSYIYYIIRIIFIVLLGEILPAITTWKTRPRKL